MKILKKYNSMIQHGREMGYYEERLMLINTVEHLKSTHGKHDNEEYYNLEQIDNVESLIEELMESEEEQKRIEQENESKKIALEFELKRIQSELEKLN